MYDLYCVKYPSYPIGDGSINNGPPKFDSKLRQKFYYPGSYWGFGYKDSADVPGIKPIININTIYNGIAMSDIRFESAIDSAVNDSFPIENYLQISFRKLNGDSLDTFKIINHFEVFDTINGTINYPDLEFEDGLYQMNLWFKDQTMTDVYFELYQDTVENTYISDLVQFNIYPNPTSTGGYNITATLNNNFTDVDFTLSIFNFTGTLLESFEFENFTGTQTPITFNFDPFSGDILLNKFTFTDNSWQTIQTITE